jgi:hypothetical protein
VGLIALDVLLAVALVALSAAEEKPSLRLSTKTPVIGIPFTTHGTGWKPGAVVALRVTGGYEPDRELGKVRVDGAGSFRREVKIPRTTGAGRRRIVARCVRNCTAQASRAVYITARPTASSLMFGAFLGTFDVDSFAWQRDLIELRNVGANVI